MCLRVGRWGRLSDDGPGHYNPDPSEDPWGGGLITLQGGARSSLRPDTVQDNRCDDEVHEGRCKLGRWTAHAGSKLKAADDPGRHRLESQPSSRTGENPPYGMIGGIEETSASFEARSAPRSYPTPINVTSPPPNDAVRKSIRSPRAGLRAARPKRRLPKSTPDFTIPCQIYPNADELCSPFGLRPALERLCHEFWPLLRGENSNTKGRG